MASRNVTRNGIRWLAPLLVLTGMVGTLLTPAPASAVQTAQSVVVNADPADWTPDILDGEATAVLQLGSKVVVGGTFTQVRRHGFSQVYTRNYLFAFDMDTGAIDQNFVPQLNGEVEQLAPGPDGSVFAGGDFSTVNGQNYKKLVRLNLSNGSIVSSFKANTNGLVLDLVSRSGWLYVSGKFTLINSVSRSGLARVNPATGAVDPNLDLPFTAPLRGSMGVPEIDVTPDGSKLVAIGSFSQVGGLPRTQIALLDVGSTPATVSSWQTDQYPVYQPGTSTTWCSSSFATYMRDVDFAPDGSYFVVATTGAYRAGRLCDSVTRWETAVTGAGQLPTWTDWTGGDTTWSISSSGAAIYMAGHFRWVNNPYRGDAAGPGAVPREGIAALDPANGLPYSWDPSHERGVGAKTLPVTASGLWVGSDTDHTGGEYHQKIAFFPASGGAALAPVQQYALPNDLYNTDQLASTLTRRSYDGTTLGSSSTVGGAAIDWQNTRGAFAINGKIYYGRSDGWLYERTFDGTNFGPQVQLNLYGLDVQPASTFLIPGTTTRVPAFTTQIRTMTGMFYDNKRLYYTVSGDNRLYYRYFQPQSEIVGANIFVASTGDGVAWNNVRGMTLASGKLIFSLTDGRLYSVNWGGTKPIGAVTQVSSALTWASRGMFMFNEASDTHAPTKPGTPSGSSSDFSSIDLTWGASSDNQSTSLTYQVFRDGNLSTPVGQVVGGTSGTISFHDSGLAAGSSHTYQIKAVDGANNVSVASDPSATITVLAPDTTPPTDPGSPTGVSNSTSTVDLSWGASTDNKDTQLTYRVFRDDPSNQVGQLTGGTTGIISFQDTGLWAGSAHTYWIQAIDGSGNASGKVQTAPVTVQAGVFSDDFSGGLANWTSVTRLSVDNAIGSAAAPSALGSPTSQSAYAYRDLGTSLSTACVSGRVNIGAQNGNAVDLLRLRTAAGGAVGKVYVNASGTLFVRNEVNSAQVTSNTVLPAGWNGLELCTTVGPSGTWSLYLNGTRIVNAWASATGTEGVGRVQIGDTAAKSWTAHFDDIVVDQAAG